MLIMNMCLNLNTCSNSLIDVMTIYPPLRWQFIAGACYARKGLHSNYWLGEYYVAGYSHHPLNYADSNRKIKLPCGVGRNIAHNLALLGKCPLLSAVGGDFYGQSLLAQTNQSGVYVDKCLIVPGENTSSYLSLLDNTGEMLVAINDMSISDCISASEFLAQHQEFIRGAKVIVAGIATFSEEALVWVLEK